MERKGCGLFVRHVQKLRGQIPVSPGAWEEAGPVGVGVGNRMGCPGLLPSTPGAHLKVHEAYAKRVPLASREQEPKPDQPSWYCPGAVSVACREQQVSPAPLPWQLQHLVLKGKAGKGRWRRHSAAFLEKPICFFPQEVMLGGQGKKNWHLGSRERRERKDSKMLQEQLS